MLPPFRSVLAGAVLSGVVALSAQSPTDCIGISFTGQVVFFDSHSGAGFLDSQLAMTGINAMCRLGPTIQFFDRTGSVLSPQFHLNAM